MRTLFLLLVLVSVSGIDLLSLSRHNQDYQNNRGTLIINQDERIEELINRHIQINRENQGIEGYRIRIFSESGQGARPRATEISAKFNVKYPDIETYLVYDAPNFKVYVGDFRSRSEALKVKRKINRDYPHSFIVMGQINFPSLD